LLDLHLVNYDVRKVVLAAERYPNVLLPGADQSQCRSFLKQRCRVFDRGLRFSLGHEFAQALDDVSGSKRLIRTAVQRLANSILISLLCIQ